MPKYREEVLDALRGPQVTDTEALIAQRAPNDGARHFASHSRCRQSSIEKRFHDVLTLRFVKICSHHRIFESPVDGVI